MNNIDAYEIFEKTLDKVLNANTALKVNFEQNGIKFEIDKKDNKTITTSAPQSTTPLQPKEKMNSAQKQRDVVNRMEIINNIDPLKNASTDPKPFKDLKDKPKINLVPKEEIDPEGFVECKGCNTMVPKGEISKCSVCNTEVCSSCGYKDPSKKDSYVCEEHF